MEAPRIPFMKESAWVKTYQDKGALFIPTVPLDQSIVHLGRLPKVTFNSELIASEESLMRMAACDLVSKAVEAGAAILTVTRVIGTMPLAEYVAAEIWKCNKVGCRALVFDDAARIHKSEIVLVAEDSFTTGRRVDLVREIVAGAGATLLPHILAQVDLSGDEEANGRMVTSLIKIDPGK